MDYSSKNEIMIKCPFCGYPLIVMWQDGREVGLSCKICKKNYKVKIKNVT